MEFLWLISHNFFPFSEKLKLQIVPQIMDIFSYLCLQMIKAHFYWKQSHREVGKLNQPSLRLKSMVKQICVLKAKISILNSSGLESLDQLLAKALIKVPKVWKLNWRKTEKLRPLFLQTLMANMTFLVSLPVTMSFK